METPREAWVDMPSRDEMRPMMAGSPYDFGFVAAMGRLVRAHPEIGAAFGMLFAQIMFRPGALSRSEREMVAAVTAAAQDCHY
jgi:alkylhydroperoxidase/carboxymuconolactone decarboxylase family protein YurZ